MVLLLRMLQDRQYEYSPPLTVTHQILFLSIHDKYDTPASRRFVTDTPKRSRRTFVPPMSSCWWIRPTIPTWAIT